MRRCLLSILFALCCVAMARGAEWQVVKIGGRDFLTLDNLAQFYGFNAGVQRSGKAFLMKTTGRSLRGEAGSVEFFINGLKFNLSYPIAEHDEALEGPRKRLLARRSDIGWLVVREGVVERGRPVE